MNYKLEVIAAGIDMSGSYTTDPWLMPEGTKATVQATHEAGSGAPNGAWKLQMTLDPTLDSSQWIDVASSSQAVTAEADTVTWVLNLNCYAIRAVYTRTSGTSTGNVIGMKQIQE